MKGGSYRGIHKKVTKMRCKVMKCKMRKEGVLHAVITYRGEIHLFEPTPISIENLIKNFSNPDDTPLGLEIDYTVKSLKEIRLYCDNCDFEEVILLGPFKKQK
jgi:hypothetical protein